MRRDTADAKNEAERERFALRSMTDLLDAAAAGENTVFENDGLDDEPI